MKAGSIVFALVLIEIAALFGSIISAAQGAPSAASVSDLSPATDRLTLPASQEIALAFRFALSSERSRLGDVVEFVVVRDVKVDGLIVIAAGSIGRGKVTAARHRGHMGKAGRLEVEFTEVPTVDGTQIGLTGKDLVPGKDRREQVMNDAGSVAIQMMGLGSMLIPAALLERGGSAEVEAGTRFDAAVAKDVQLEKASVEQNQLKASPDEATIFIIHGEYLTCGTLLLIPGSDWSRVIRMEIPEGRYWFHAGVPRSAVRDFSIGLLYGFTLTAVDLFDYHSAKTILKRPIDEFFPLDVKKGQTYYIRGIFRPDDVQSKDKIRSAGAEEAEEVLGSTYNRFLYLRDLPPKVVHRLQAEPKRIQMRKK